MSTINSQEARPDSTSIPHSSAPDSPPKSYPSSPNSPAVFHGATECYNATDSSRAIPRVPNRTALRDRLQIQTLSGKQLIAIELLVGGRTDADVAALVGVHRVTVTRWRLYHSVFQAELNRRRHQVFGTAAEAFRSTLMRAVRTLRRQLRHEKPLVACRAARAMLALAHEFTPPDQPADPLAFIDLYARASDSSTNLSAQAASKPSAEHGSTRRSS